jgi:hypothetical protein
MHPDRRHPKFHGERDIVHRTRPLAREECLYVVKGGSLRSPPTPAAGGRRRPSSPAPCLRRGNLIRGGDQRVAATTTGHGRRQPRQSPSTNRRRQLALGRRRPLPHRRATGIVIGAAGDMGQTASTAH